MSYPSLRATVCLLLCLLSLSCGKKNAPVPPHSIPTAPINNLSYELDENGVTLSFKSYGITFLT